ncbi:hypothetical protein EGJ52_21535, partial [Pseudomonas luteola]|uniref:hypothetical protein n=1 Tax=Pseudomonas luteola TaxID=47886 RepID=UPI000FAAA34F
MERKMALDNATALPGVRVVTRFGNGALDEYFSYGEQPATAEQIAQFTAGSTCHREQVQSELNQGRLLINDDLDRLSRRCERLENEAQEADRSRQQIAAQRNAVSGL